jgi:DNA-binding transcriptional ArsR family regulator
MSKIRSDSDVFTAVADPTRRAILDRLSRGGASVNELAGGFSMTRPAVSRHLRVLRESGLVREHREGRRRVYELTPQPLRDVDRWIEAYRSFWEVNLLNLKRHLEGGGA